MTKKDKTWDGSMMPSQKGKLAVVTGANSGIGFEVAKELAAHGAHVILACRNEERGQQAEERIRSELALMPNEVVGSVEVMQVDIGDFDSVRDFARAFHDKFDHLDLLINNAGVYGPTQRHTPNGLEIHFATNHLGHFYLTSLLLDLLRKSKHQARVVSVSSVTHYFAWMFLNFSKLGHTKGSSADYTTSKLANLLFLSNYSVDWSLLSDIWNRFYTAKFPKWLAKIAIRVGSWLPFMTPPMGALSILYAATMESVKGGEYYGPNGFLHFRGYPALEAGSKSSHSLENANKLWKLSEDMINEEFKL
ncbi:putative short-chain dehydrogenase/reductase SDR, NAD(P)-binding domain superfamily [Plasmopara halstedii]